MSRYIDANKVYEMAIIHEDFKQSIADLVSLKEALDDIPTADMQEVVRCKNCIYFIDKQRKNRQGICMCGEKDTSYGAEFYPYADNFCSYGERKEQE